MREKRGHHSSLLLLYSPNGNAIGAFPIPPSKRLNGIPTPVNGPRSSSGARNPERQAILAPLLLRILPSPQRLCLPPQRPPPNRHLPRPIPVHGKRRRRRRRSHGRREQLQLQSHGEGPGRDEGLRPPQPQALQAPPLSILGRRGLHAGAILIRSVSAAEIIGSCLPVPWLTLRYSRFCTHVHNKTLLEFMRTTT